MSILICSSNRSIHSTYHTSLPCTLYRLLSPSTPPSMSTEATTAILCINSFTNLVYEALHDSLIFIIMDKGEQPLFPLSLVVIRYTVGSPLLTLVLLSSHYTSLPSQQSTTLIMSSSSTQQPKTRKVKVSPPPSTIFKFDGD